MQKIGASTPTANGSGEFTHGQPGSGVDATQIMPAWLNAIQRELVHVVEAAGLTLDTADDSQVFKAIQAIQASAATWLKISGKPTTIAGFGITDAFTKPETTSAIQQAIASLVASSPAALDTLKELADALGNDPNFATTMTNALAGKASKATTLGGYGINDAFTKAEVIDLIPSGPVQATESVKGIARVSSNFQMAALTDDQTMVTPLKMAPLANRVAALEGSQVFTKASISPEQTITAGGSLIIPHGLGVQPVLWESYLVCKEAEYGYWVGATILIPSSGVDNLYNLGVSVVSDAANLNCKFGSQPGVFFVLDWATGATKVITPSKWRLVVRAWA